MARTYSSKKRPHRSYSKKNSSFGGGKWIFLGVLIGLGVAVAFWHYQSAPAEKASTSASNVHRSQRQANLPVGKPAAANTAANTQTATNPPQTRPAANTGPEFDFYTVLPKMQVPNGGTVQQRAPVKPSAPTATPVTAGNTVASGTPALPGTAPTTTLTVPPTNAVPAAPNPNPVNALPAKPTPPPQEAQRTPPPPPDAAPQKPAGNERYLLQVASLPNYSDADRLKAQLAMQGFEVSIQKYYVNGQPWHRVYVGSYSSREAALKQQAALKQSNVSSILIKQP